ncbi:MAG: phenylalanine--tRNA ligase subunit beta [Candidatus Omnitrophota bacterium]
MKFTYAWLKDFVDVNIQPQALADKLTMAGLEVVSLEEQGGDFIFEIEITSNRPDWLSVIGIAREVAAVTNSKLKWAGVRYQVPGVKKQPSFYIKVEDKKDCLLYTAKIIKDVKAGSSPEWLRKRLELVGCRSVNNIVDITNYILFTYGHPLHAFDLDKLHSDTIIVRRARPGEKVTTISDKQAALDREILVIADKEKPVAVAGVMGGKDTEVTQNTKNILLESAVFNPVVVRRSRQKLGMQSESSYRFERGTDFKTALAASSAALKMINEISGGVCVAEKLTPLPKTKGKQIPLSAVTVENTLGVKIPAARVKAILSHLGFSVKQKTKESFSVKPPSFRQDANSDIDLIEEIGRISGYNQIPATLPYIKPQLTPCRQRDLVSALKNILIGLGLNEVITYSLIDRELIKGYAVSAKPLEPVEVMNPLSKEQEVLRPMIGPSLIRCISYNLNQKQPYVNIFEVANIFPGSNSQGLPREELVLGIALCGEKSMLLERGLVSERMSMLHLKGILETVFQRLGISGYTFTSGQGGGVSALLGDEKLASLQTVNKDFLNRMEIKNREVFVAEVYLDKVFAAAGLKKKFNELPAYPGILRAISLLLKEEISSEQVLSLIKISAGDLLAEARISDYYKGKQVPVGLRGLTISCLYRSASRTLTDEEINSLHSRVLQALVDKFQVRIR